MIILRKLSKMERYFTASILSKNEQNKGNRYVCYCNNLVNIYLPLLHHILSLFIKREGRKEGEREGREGERDH